jgi:hypothetical protein
MADIPFTQYMRPNGRQVVVSIDRPAEIAAKAEKIIARGFRFECEHLTTGHASLTIADDRGDHAIEVVANGPEVPLAVDRLITNFDLDKASRAA